MKNRKLNGKFTILIMIPLILLLAFALMTTAEAQDTSTDPTATPAWNSSLMPGSMMGSTTTGMSSGDCPMMSGSMTGGMTGASSMSGMTGMQGMSMTGTTGMNTYGIENDISTWFQNPWWLLGWVLLALVVLAILGGAVFGIVTLIRRGRSPRPG